jgi:FkbM family methyltransferase
MVGSFEIRLPIEHNLPVYQSEHFLYDKFLEILVASIPQKDFTVMTVGANVGDTLASLASVRTDCTYVNLEADSDFYQFLEWNSSQIAKSTGAKVINLKRFVGQSAKVNEMEGQFGTKHAKFDSTLPIAKLVTLDEIVLEFELSNVELIIIDTDGFDWDILLSAAESISKYKPIIFFEMFLPTQQTLDFYMSEISRLSNLGYFFTIFDNFGNLICKNQSIDKLSEIAIYIFRQNNIGTRTIYYLDVLASTEAQEDEIGKALKNYEIKFFSN